MALSEPSPQYLEGLYQRLRGRASDMAPQLGADPSAKTLTPDEIDTLWNTRAMPLEQEWALWRQTQPDGSPVFTPEQIGLMVYTYREELAKRGGRVEPREETLWANQQAKRSEARRAADPLPPDPTHTLLTGQKTVMSGQDGRVTGGVTHVHVSDLGQPGAVQQPPTATEGSLP